MFDVSSLGQSGRFHPIDRLQTCTEDSAVDSHQGHLVPQYLAIEFQQVAGVGPKIIDLPTKASNPLGEVSLPLLNSERNHAFQLFPAFTQSSRR